MNGISTVKCSAHTTQLCCSDVHKKPSVSEFLATVRKMVKFIRAPRNGHRSEFRDSRVKLPTIDVATRWLSTYNMVESLNQASTFHYFLLKT